MERVVEGCAGLDVHKDTVMACVRVPGVEGERVQDLREYATTTVELLALGDWLMAWGVTVVAMESTGVYWKPVCYLLEDDVECWLLNADGTRRADQEITIADRRSGRKSGTLPVTCESRRPAGVGPLSSGIGPLRRTSWLRCKAVPGYVP
jgi:Transposase